MTNKNKTKQGSKEGSASIGESIGEVMARKARSKSTRADLMAALINAEEDLANFKVLHRGREAACESATRAKWEAEKARDEAIGERDDALNRVAQQEVTINKLVGIVDKLTKEQD